MKKKTAHVKVSSNGGLATLKKYGKGHFSKIAKDAWAKRKKMLRAALKGSKK